MMIIEENAFSVKVIPNSATNDVIGFDAMSKAYKVRIKAPAKDNKANAELVKFLSKLIGKKVIIKSGVKSKIKKIDVVG